MQKTINTYKNTFNFCLTYGKSKNNSRSSYLYGFNGKERDDEVSGAGNDYDYGFRVYNPRLGRFLSVDSLTKGYPWYTPYQFAGNKPIIAIDLDGLEEYIVTVRTFLPYDYVFEPVNQTNIDKGNSRTYAQYHNVDAHGGYKSEQVLTINFNEQTSTLTEKIPITYVYNLVSKEVFTYKNKGNGATGSTSAKFEGDKASSRLEMNSSNPAVSYGPTIDYGFDIVVSKDGIISVGGVWDGFPALEIFLENKETKKTYLVKFINTSDAGKNTATDGNPDDILDLMPYLGDKKIGFSTGIKYLEEHKDKNKPTENAEKSKKLFTKSE